MADWVTGKMNIRGSFENMNRFIQENFIDSYVVETDDDIVLETKYNYELNYDFGVPDILIKERINSKNKSFDISNIGDAFFLGNFYNINVFYSETTDICYMSMNLSHRYDINIDAFIELSKKYNLDFNTVVMIWDNPFVHKLRIEKGIVVKDEVIEDDASIYFEL
jgi:hypothetical protein